MLPENLTFACPACDCRLTVPISYAGVVGPCPHCNTRIQAPVLPPGYGAAAAGGVPATAAPAPAQSVADSADPPPGYKPEPRQLPQRTEGKEPIGKRVTDSMRSADDDVVSGKRRSPLLRMIPMLVFLVVLGAMVFVLLQFVAGSKGPVEPKPLVPMNSGPSSKAAAAQAKSNLPPPAPDMDETVPVAPAVASGIPAVNPTPVLPELSSQVATKPSASTSALRVLEQFLSAKSLSERLPLMETATPQAELETSCLAKPLPQSNAIPYIEKENTLESASDFYFNVIFPGQGGREAVYQTLVRIRGDQEPKVVADAFLDLYGGRLRKFAEHVSDKPGTFQIIVSAGPLCSDRNIPNADNKYPLKLVADATGREIATAYAGHNSRIGILLAAQTELRWAVATPCTIMLAWNKEDPAKPYIEASMITALNWSH